ncbi:hypothetical protein TNCV_135471 [Trichonephila clavipes]|nr:hypothetical protein TNCV_135471 [Trichonephila clavipes]
MAKDKQCLSFAAALTPYRRHNDLARIHPNFEGESLEGGQGPLTSLPIPPTSREDFRLNGCLIYHHAAKALNIHKHPCILRVSNTGTAVSVANHHTGWAMHIVTSCIASHQ